MEARDRRIIEKMLAVINHKNTSDADAEAAFHGIRRIMARLGLRLEQVVGGGGDDGEADRWRRAYERLQRQMGRRMDAANAARTAAADGYAAEVARIIQGIIREHPGIGSDGIAAELQRRKVRTPSGGTGWSRMQVHRVMQRVGKW